MRRVRHRKGENARQCSPSRPRDGLAAVEELLTSVRPVSVSYDEQRFGETLEGIMERFEELAAGSEESGIDEVERTLLSVRPAGAEFDRSVFQRTKHRLAGDFEDLNGTAGPFVSARVARAPSGARRTVLRLGGAVALAVLVALSLFFWLRKPATEVEQQTASEFEWKIMLPDLARLPEGLRAIARAHAPVVAEPVQPPVVEEAEPDEREVPEPEEVPAPETPAPQEVPTVALEYYTVSSQGITLSWKQTSAGSGGAGSVTAVVLRSAEGLEPQFPANRLSGDLQAGQYTDAAVEGARGYVYRVVLLKDGSPVAYSNSISARVDSNVVVSLSGGLSGGRPALNWTTEVSGFEPGITGYTLFRSTSPADWGGAVGVEVSGKSGSYRDAPPRSDIIWYYRLVACRGGLVIATSNTVAVYPENGLEREPIRSP